MNITRLSAISLAGLALSAGTASAATIEYNEFDGGDLLGPGLADVPPANGITGSDPEEFATLDFAGANQFFELEAGDHLVVNGTVGLGEVGEDGEPTEDLWDLFKFSASEEFTLSNIDFEFDPDNLGNTGFRLLDDSGNEVDRADAFVPDNDTSDEDLFTNKFAAGTYIFGVFDTTPDIRQPFHLGVTVHDTPSEVPLPAAAWFLVGGVAALGAAKAGRRRKT
jgi:hypothetical protein